MAVAPGQVAVRSPAISRRTGPSATRWQGRGDSGWGLLDAGSWANLVTVPNGGWWSPNHPAVWNITAYNFDDRPTDPLVGQVCCTNTAGCASNSTSPALPNGASTLKDISADVTDHSAPNVDGTDIWDNGDVNAGPWVDIGGGTTLRSARPTNVGVKNMSWQDHRDGAWSSHGGEPTK